MNWAWATSLDQIWRSPGSPLWLILAAAGFFGIVMLITLRAEKSVANGALIVIMLLAVCIALAATIRELAPAGRPSAEMTRSSQRMNVALPALSCIDDLAGDIVLAACEKALFGSAEAAAAAVSYAASQISRLIAFGDVAAANGSMTPELQALRAAVERDRYGLVAQVLLARDHCTPSNCRAFRALTDNRQIVANMGERTYDGLIARYAPLWNTPAVAAPGPVATLAPTMPTGKPTNADFPSAASTPAVSIMTPEPTAPPASSAPRAPASQPVANAPPPSPRPPATAGSTTAAAKKKEAAPKHTPVAQHTPAPVQLAPPPGAPAPAASND
jgi:hypothetical protein